MIPKKKLTQDPASIFDQPSDVLDNQELSREQKIEVLRLWKNDVLQKIVAEEEAMPGDPDNSVLLQKISDTLIALGED